MPTEHHNKTCRTCKKVLPISSFAFTGSHNRRSICKTCINTKQLANKHRRHKLSPPPRHAPANKGQDLNVILRWRVVTDGA